MWLIDAFEGTIMNIMDELDCGWEYAEEVYAERCDEWPY